MIAAVLIAGACLPASAKPFPSRPILLVVPSEPSGTADVLTRTIAPFMAEDLGQPVLVQNRPGPGGVAGVNAAVRAEPDGYTLVIGSAALPAQVIGPARLPYDPAEDLSAVSPFATIPCFVLVNAAAPVDTLAGLISAAKRAPDGLTYASSGFGSGAHVAGALFAAAIGTHLLHVPYRATAPAINDLIAGHVDMMLVGLPTNPAYLRSANLKALAVAAPARVPLLPDVPTVSQAGGPDFSVSAWLAVLAPRGTPAAVKVRLAEAIHHAVRRPEVAWRYAALGALPFTESVAQFEARYEAEIEMYRGVSRENPGLLD